MIETGGLFGLLIFIIIAVIVAAVILWCVDYFFPEANRPARFIVGGIALVAILIKAAGVFGVAV